MMELFHENWKFNKRFLFAFSTVGYLQNCSLFYTQPGQRGLERIRAAKIKPNKQTLHLRPLVLLIEISKNRHPHKLHNIPRYKNTRSVTITWINTTDFKNRTGWQWKDLTRGIVLFTKWWNMPFSVMNYLF